ncbi:amino acid adenylation domain-containing protein [Streptomyces cellostaticus]|uniref:amino acid adenylation domain-containing protein n=1 Tax=Streptomyces cellostaticus TaxID=67285 RepID=UPI002025D832|nr:amino acid adenylation domain-containing protein [Streptomyces cellostaticus]
MTGLVFLVQTRRATVRRRVLDRSTLREFEMIEQLSLNAAIPWQARRTADAALGGHRPPDPHAPRLSWDPASLAHLPREQWWLLHQFGQGPAAAPSHSCIHHPIEEFAAARPLAAAAEHEGRTLNYGELDARANRLAALLTEQGVRPGDRVGLFLRRSLPMLVGVLAVLKTGAAYVPQDAGQAPAAQVEHVVRTAGITVVLTTSAYEGELAVPPGTRLVAVDRTLEEPLPPHTPGFRPLRPVHPDDVCYVLFTSGTTGRPNGVAVTHRNVCNLLLTAPGDLGIRPGWRVGQILNIAFDMAAWEILGALAHGATLVVRGTDTAAAVRDADVIIATPSVLAAIDPGDCARVRVVAVAGEPCPRTLADTWARRCTFYNGCGPTETTIVNTLQRHCPAAPSLTIGRPTPNNTVYILDPRGRLCPPGEVGEMWAGGDGVSAGYLAAADLNTERYAPDPFLGGSRLMFRTRDLGRWTAEGELEHLGRTDDQVKIRGFRVELDAVSTVLESVPGCERAVTLKTDDRTLMSFVTPATVDADAARAAVADALPYYCVPTAVHRLPHLPQTDRGKVDKAALRRLAMQGGTA